jgi:hypothetical protein
MHIKIRRNCKLTAVIFFIINLMLPDTFAFTKLFFTFLIVDATTADDGS